MSKKLYLSQRDKKLSGVCGGIADYLNMDAGLVRILWILGSLFLGGFGGVIAYIAVALVLPKGVE